MENKKWELAKDISSIVIAASTILILLVNAVLICFTYQSNKRMEKLFVGQNKPLIDVTPLGISYPSKSEDGMKMAKTRFSVVNYSGFVAKKIAIDVKYGGYDWISEWGKAYKDDKENKEKKEEGVVKGRFYQSTPKILIQKLKPGKTTGRNYKGELIAVSGSLDLDYVCSKGKEGFRVLVRVTWENTKGHVFDEVHKYKLICTKFEGGDGRAFTFIPEGIISQKNTPLTLNINVVSPNSPQK